MALLQIMPWRGHWSLAMSNPIRVVVEPIHTAWTAADEAELQRWKKKDIKMGDTAFGRLVANKKRMLDAAQDHYTREERDKARAKFAVMDAAEARVDAADAMMEDGEEGGM